MRSVTAAALAVIAIASAAALLSPGRASATAVCEDEAIEGICNIPYEKGTILAAESTNLSFSTSLGTINCSSSAFEEELTQEPSSTKEVLRGQMTSWTNSGCVSILGSCSTAPVSELSETLTLWTKESNAVHDFSFELLVQCGVFLHCVYAINPEAKITGGKAGKALLSLNEGEVLGRIGGFFCPTTTSWSGTYTFTGPELGEVFVAGQATPATVYCKTREGPCARNNHWGKPNIKAKLMTGTNVKFNWGMGNPVRDTCTTSELEGTTTRVGAPLRGTISKWSFGGCTCATSALLLPWDTKLEAIAATDDGVLSWESGGEGNPILHINGCNGQNCEFSDPSFVLVIDGGNIVPKVLLPTLTISERNGGCGSVQITEGTYEVEAPKPVWIERVK